MSDQNWDNTNRFSLWRNDRARDERDAKYTGSINVEGIEFFIDAWPPKEGASDRAPVLSGRIKRKDKQPGANLAEAAPAAEFSDDVPF